MGAPHFSHRKFGRSTALRPFAIQDHLQRFFASLYQCVSSKAPECHCARINSSFLASTGCRQHNVGTPAVGVGVSEHRTPGAARNMPRRSLGEYKNTQQDHMILRQVRLYDKNRIAIRRQPLHQNTESDGIGDPGRREPVPMIRSMAKAQIHHNHAGAPGALESP